MAERCDKQVRTNPRWPSFRQCSNKAIGVTADGKHYCKIHSPETAAAKKAKIAAQIEALKNRCPTCNRPWPN